MAASDFPNSYKDPLYASLDAQTEQKLGLPDGLLSSIRTNGEKSNHDQVSDAGAQTVYQFTPTTRKLIVDKYGVDPKLSPQNASEAAGLLLKEGLDRNNGDPALAASEYIGGKNRANWGPTTKAYSARVVAGLPGAQTTAPAPVTPSAPAGAPLAAGQSTFDKVMAQMSTPQDSHMATVLGAYQAGKMTPEDAKAFEGDVKAGKIMLPPGVKLGGSGSVTTPPPMPEGLAQAYQQGTMAPEDRASLDALIKSGQVAPPVGSSQIPGQTAGAPSNVGQRQADPTMGQRIVGAGEAALNLGTGMAAGAVAPIAGLATALTSPDASKGNLQGASDAASLFAQNNTYAPRTDQGQSQAAVVGDVMSNAVPLMGMGGEMATAGQAAQALKPTVAAIPALARNTLGAAAENVAALPGRVAEVVRPAEPVAPPAPVAVPTAVDAVAPRPVVAEATPVTPAEVAPNGAPLMTPDDLTQTAKKAAAKGVDSTHAADLAAQTAPDAGVVGAAKRLGIEDYLQPDHVSSNQSYREFAQAVKSLPTSEARAAELTGLDQVGKRAEQVISDIGGNTDVSQTSSNTRAALDDAHAKFSAQADKLYGEVNKTVPKTMTVEPTSTLDFLKTHADEVGGADRLLAPEQKLLSSLAGDADRPVTYAYLDQTRKQIGQALRKASGPFADSESGLLKKLYSTLSDDQSAAVKGVSDDAYNTFKAAQAATMMQKGIENDLSSLFGKELDKSLSTSLRSAITALPQGDGAKLAKLLASVPAEMRQEVAASGVATAFRTAGTRGPISFTQYAKWYEGLLRNKQAYNAIMTNLPGKARKQLSDLYRVSSGISAASKERITTGRIQAFTQGMNGADSLATQIYEGAKRNAVAAGAGAVAGAVHPGLGVAVASALSKGPKPAAMAAADALIASSEFAQLARAGPKPPPAVVKRVAYSPAFKRYVAAIGKPAAMKNPEEWVRNVIYGSALEGGNNNQRNRP